MSKSLRLSEKWFRRGLWLVALVFAGFLIGLGSTIVGDLPQVERVRTIEDFIDHRAADPLRATVRPRRRPSCRPRATSTRSGCSCRPRSRPAPMHARPSATGSPRAAPPRSPTRIPS